MIYYFIYILDSEQNEEYIVFTITDFYICIYEHFV